MLIKDEIKLLHQAGLKDLPLRKDAGGKKKKLIALREVRHMLDEVSTRRTILRKENEDVLGAITSMREALASMPKAVRDERAKLMMRHQKARGTPMNMANENIRESLYAMNLASSGVPIILAAATASSLVQQQVICNSLVATIKQPPRGYPLPVTAAETSSGKPANIPILPQMCPSASVVPSMVGSGGFVQRHQ